MKKDLRNLTMPSGALEKVFNSGICIFVSSCQRRVAVVALALLACLEMSAAVSFLSLDKQIQLCRDFLASDEVSQYPTVSVQELQDILLFAETQKTNASVTQSQVNSYRDALKDKLAKVKALKGFVPNEEKLLRGEYDANRGFVHPGALHTEADFVRIRQQLAEKDSFVVAAYAKLTENSYSKYDAYVGPVDTIRRGGSGWQNYIYASRAAHIAYMNGLMWHITGDARYARNGIRHLNEWAATCKMVTGDSNQSLAAGLTGYQFANAGELLRNFSEWSATDFKAYQRWMLDVWYTANNGFLRYRAGTWQNSGKWWQAPGHYWSNWGLCNTLSVISIGIVCDDPFIYSQGLSWYKYQHVKLDDAWPNNFKDGIIYDSGLNEFLPMLVPTVADDERGPFGKLGQMEESGRDQGHAQLALGLAVDICQTAFNQGDDLWAYMDDRLAAGIEWSMAYNTMDTTEIKTLPWTPFKYATNGIYYTDGRSWLQSEPGSASRGTIRPYMERILGYYEGYRGVTMRYCEKGREIIGMEGGGGGNTSGGYDHLGLTSLTCHRDRVSAEQAPTIITAKLSYQGKTLDQAELGSLDDTYATDTCKAIPAGSEVEFLPQLPSDETNTGKWEWSTGERTQNLKITATRSQVYHVTYENSRGVKSTATYTIAVKGDCQVDAVKPFITYDGKTIADTTINVLAYSDVTLKIVPFGGWGKMEWSNGSTSDEITAEMIGHDREYSVIYTNQGGAQSKTTFHIHVIGMTATLSVDNGEFQAADSVVVMKGQKLTLMPVTTDGYNAGEWMWSNGATTDSLVLDNVESSDVYTVVHTFGTRTDTLAFKVQCTSPDFGPNDGNYYVMDAATSYYLTNTGLSSPKFDEKNEVDATSQTWTITKDGDRYKIVSAMDGKHLNYNARLTAEGSYNQDKSSFYFYGLDGTSLYAIRSGDSAGAMFWTVNSHTTLNTKGSDALQGFPFKLVFVSPTDGISAVRKEKSANHFPYSLTGQRVDDSYRGIVIIDGKKIIRR